MLSARSQTHGVRKRAGKRSCLGGQGGAVVTGWKGARELLSNMLFPDLDAEYTSIPSGKIQQAVHQALCPFLYVYLSLKNTFTKYYTVYLMKYKFLVFVVNPIMNTSQFRFQVTRGNPRQNLKHMMFIFPPSVPHSLSGAFLSFEKQLPTKCGHTPRPPRFSLPQQSLIHTQISQGSR